MDDDWIIDDFTGLQAELEKANKGEGEAHGMYT